MATITFYIFKSVFLNWYLESGSDDERKEIMESIAEIVVRNLKDNGKSVIDIEQLFYACNRGIIPIKLLVHEDGSSIEVYDIVDTREIKIELLND